jgi:hypothetical protein
LPVDESGNVQTEDPYGLPFRKSWWVQVASFYL